jgi:phenylalanyl-tRNA synthetase beta chain
LKFSLAWIREFVEVSVSPVDLARRLTSAGLPVETISGGPEGDTIIDIEVFSNRPDCMNVYGVAREIAAATGHALCPYPAGVAETAGSPAASKLATVRIEDADLCGRYSARVMQGVRIGPSPEWLARRLASVGLRCVNNVVDVTNYLLWEFGHPLHAFDLDTLAGRQIRVRRARRAESITTLDGVARTLTPDTLVIADAERPVAIAGVMGGTATMVSERTTGLLIESAWFDPVSVRRTAKRLPLSTDASYRFERGADIEATVVALNRAAELIQQVAGGSICPGVLEARPAPPASRRLHLRAARVSRLVGLPVDPGEIERALVALQFAVARREEGLEVEVPSHRQDIEHEVDLIEEVARHIGYENVPERLPQIAGTGGINRAGHRREPAIRRALSAAGYSEAMTSSFSSPGDDWGLRQRLDPHEPAIVPISLANPIAAGQEILRTTLLAGLLASVAHNLNHGTRDVRLYEIGRTFRRGQAAPPPHEDRKHPPAGPVEEIVTLGIVTTGNARPPHWLEPRREATFHDLKGLLESIFAEIGACAGVEPLGGSEALDTSRAALLLASGTRDGETRRVGRLGALTQAWRERLDIRQEVLVAEVNLTEVFAMTLPPVAFRPLPRFPAVSRDLSLIVGKDQPYGGMERSIRDAAPDRIASVSVFDRYPGERLPAGTVGLSVNIVYQHPERTLSTQEVAELQEKILEKLEAGFGAKLRD